MFWKNNMTSSQLKKWLDWRDQTINCKNEYCNDIYGKYACGKCNEYYDIHRKSLEVGNHE